MCIDEHINTYVRITRIRSMKLFDMLSMFSTSNTNNVPIQTKHFKGTTQCLVLHIHTSSCQGFNIIGLQDVQRRMVFVGTENTRIESTFLWLLFHHFCCFNLSIIIIIAVTFNSNATVGSSIETVIATSNIAVDHKDGTI